MFVSPGRETGASSTTFGLPPSSPAPILFGLPLHGGRIRVLHLQPGGRPARAIARAEPLAHDALDRGPACRLGGIYQREPAMAGITCSSGSGLIEISPVKGRSCASISKVDAAIPVAKIPIAMIEASRLSLWTMAIATSAQTA